MCTHLADVLHALPEAAFALRGARRELARRDHAALVEPDGDSFLRSHFARW